MPLILQVITVVNDNFATAVVADEAKQPGTRVRKFDLTESAPDYDELLEEIFRADAIHVW